MKTIFFSILTLGILLSIIYLMEVYEIEKIKNERRNKKMITDYEEELRKLNYQIYERMLLTISDEELISELKTRMEVFQEFDGDNPDYGKAIDLLLDWYANVLYDEPNYKAYDIDRIKFNELQ